MEIKINILNVKDGDAIIIELIKKEKSLVMVIDGGELQYYESKMKPKLQQVLKTHNKKAPDIVVCTHYDSDHIGGLTPMIEDYINDIKEVWLHITPELSNDYIKEANSFLNEGEAFYPSIEGFSIQNLFEGYDVKNKNILDSKVRSITESLPQLRRLIQLIPSSKIRQVFHKQTPIYGWEEITILGPTESYYNNLYQSNKSFIEFLKEEAMVYLQQSQTKIRFQELANINPCETLRKDDKTHQSTTNKSSIIISIVHDDKKYLFTGDAGIESFKKIPEWKKELENVFFLKIPHHGSANNISKELIEIMNPVYAYNSGFEYENKAVLGCLKKMTRNKEVKTTSISDDLYFDK